MVPGSKVMAIFGFCDIRQFTDTTEVLQEEVMEFVNTIARIVHMEVSLHGGSPNKNIGDAFLLVWKLPASFNARALRQQEMTRRAQQTSFQDPGAQMIAAGPPTSDQNTITSNVLGESHTVIVSRSSAIDLAAIREAAEGGDDSPLKSEGSDLPFIDAAAKEAATAETDDADPATDAGTMASVWQRPSLLPKSKVSDLSPQRAGLLCIASEVPSSRASCK